MWTYFWGLDTPYVLNNLIHPVDLICEYLSGIGKEQSEERFGCWALTQFRPQEIFKDTDPVALFLYSYLTTLSRKKEYSIDYTPRKIKKYLNPEALQSAYTELTDKGFLSLNENDFWIHSTQGQVPSLREDMKVAVSICDFIYSVEFMTKSIKRDIELIRTTDQTYKVMSKRTSTRHLCPCPVCSSLPDDDVEIPVELITTEPFHYNCGPWRPLVVLEP